MPKITCDLCDKICASPSQFIEHMRTHTGEKPFQCPTCFKSFATQSNFTRHTRTHTGEKPYGCQACDKSFSDKSNLDRHIKTHIGNKPFHCLDCYNSYTSARNLRVHRDKNHPNEGTSTVTTIHSQVEPMGIVMTTTQTIASSSNVTTVSSTTSPLGAACSVTQHMPTATLTTVIQEGAGTVATNISYPPPNSVDEIFSAMQRELLADTSTGNEGENSDPFDDRNLFPDFWLD